ncbi:MAG: hypothetical protein EZS26_002512 [Candidatus Ordinivivax streblomastigis]|jgi:hypothetical protein|uniref:Uncharacterized protein n=1 Tax=Candidatus Ordinivivax streblomastigis TaxID=2540710 RepID=A0A5M8NYT4_9BACT|nr:MAG: hypothetical protein EZS26_002512 [Candidatus Ordinivivax streblomastigis]
MITIKDITGASIEVTDLDAAINQLEEFCEIPCSFKISGTPYTVGEDHAFMLEQLKAIKQQQKRDRRK